MKKFTFWYQTAPDSPQLRASVMVSISRFDDTFTASCEAGGYHYRNARRKSWRFDFPAYATVVDDGEPEAALLKKVRVAFLEKVKIVTKGDNYFKDNFPLEGSRVFWVTNGRIKK